MPCWCECVVHILRSVEMCVLSVCVMFLMIEKMYFYFLSVQSIGLCGVWWTYECVCVCVITHNFRFTHWWWWWWWLHVWVRVWWTTTIEIISVIYYYFECVKFAMETTQIIAMEYGNLCICQSRLLLFLSSSSSWLSMSMSPLHTTGRHVDMYGIIANKPIEYV